MTNLDSVLKSRAITLLRKVYIVKTVVMYRCETWTIKKAEHRIDAFELRFWNTLSRVPWTARISNQSILKEINPEYSLEGLMLIAEAPVFWPPYAKRLLLLSHFSCVRLSVTPETAAHQAPPSLGFSRQEHWSGLPFPSSKHESEK